MSRSVLVLSWPGSFSPAVNCMSFEARCCTSAHSSISFTYRCSIFVMPCSDPDTSTAPQLPARCVDAPTLRAREVRSPMAAWREGPRRSAPSQRPAGALRDRDASSELRQHVRKSVEIPLLPRCFVLLALLVLPVCSFLVSLGAVPGAHLLANVVHRGEERRLIAPRAKGVFDRLDGLALK